MTSRQYHWLAKQNYVTLLHWTKYGTATSLHMLNVANVMSSSIDTISEGTYVVVRIFITNKGGICREANGFDRIRNYIKKLSCIQLIGYS